MLQAVRFQGQRDLDEKFLENIFVKVNFLNLLKKDLSHGPQGKN